MFKGMFLFVLLFQSIIVANTKITLQLSWFDQFQFAGYYIAKEKGFYEDEGLDVDIKAFEFGLDIPKGVSNGTYDFAIGRETLVLDQTNNQDIIALYALLQASPLILISTKESGIKSIKDFEDKKIMTTIDDANEVSLKSMITSQNIDIKNLNFIKHIHNINDLVNKNTDVISAYTSKAPYHLNQLGIEYTIFAPKEYGFDMYSDFLFTSKKKLKDDCKTVDTFKNASLKGWEYAYDNIEESVEIILEKYNHQNLSKDELIFEAKELEKLSYYQTDELGDINLDKFQRIYDLYNVMGLVQNKIVLKDFVLPKNDFFSFIKNVQKNLAQYIQLPYIYFFISLFFILIITVIVEYFKLRKLNEELLEKNKDLKVLSENDPLTNLYNRRYFEMIANEHFAYAKREGEFPSLIILDIDYFKKVNDLYGHQVGDEVLVHLAKLLLDKKRDSDIICRYGGEEFIIFLPNTSKEGAQIFAQKLKSSIQKTTLEFNNFTINITVSMGVTTIKKTDSISSAFSRADGALYVAKNNGRNQIEFL
mgnify:CR=1 FL=1